ncbi:MAG: T9SS type A sorting domain-containing protein [Cytophagales bacterium]|nr:T9SS type A sorting domain-containing protein [Cytophagales bacterium]
METPNPVPANRIKFWMYTPPGYNANTPAPLLINLHGQFQIGNNLNTLISDPNDATPAYLIANSQWPASRPFIVVSPQLKPDGTPIADQDWPANYIDEVVEYVKTIRTINTNKIYIMGLSLGGQGCMIYSAAYPNKVAAMIPICGRTDDIIQDGLACSLVNIPTWIFHGTEDITLNYSNATNMAAAINACPNPGSIKPHVTLLDAGEHRGVSVWNPLYNTSTGYPVYDWLLKFTKNSTANVLPYVNAGSDKKFLVSDNTIYLFGDYFDDDGAIASVAWAQTQGTALTLQQTNTRILKITNLQAGTFQFRLTVTDNLGGISTDDVEVILYGSVPMGMKSITSLRLTNAATGNTDIGPLVNEQIVNKSVVGTNDLNVRAIMPTEGGSVVFKVNSNQFTRGLSAWGINNLNNLYVYPNDPWYFPNGWKILTGDHVVCASPYADNGTEGISKCVKFSVINPIIQDYYPKPGLDLSLLSSWGTNPTNGSGTPPPSFNSNTNSNFQIFNVNKVATQSGPLTIGGNESALWVRNDGEMFVNNTFTGLINVEGNGIVNVNTSQPVAFGSISPTSTIRFGANATSIPAHTYGNVVVQSGTKTLSSGTTIIMGNLTIADNVIVNGVANNTSTIQLTGNLILQEDGEFNPTTKFGITLTGGTPHTINLTGTKAVFNHLTVLGSSAVTVTEGIVPKTIELGSATGGGVVVANGSELNLGKNHLTITGAGTINPQNQTGKIAFDKSNITIASSSAFHSNLYTKPTRDTVVSLAANLTGGGALYLRDSVFLTERLKIFNGTLHATNFLTLVSTATQTARIERVEGTGAISGAVRFQRYVNAGRLYRYLSFPVKNVKVSDLQKHVPVTGNFIGRSVGPGFTTNASLFQYVEPVGWLPYPTISNTEEFLHGRGYSVFFRKADDPTIIQVAGEVHIGDFNFQLNQGSANQNLGWSLVGNPYAAPIQWSATGWENTGINTTIYVRDNEYASGAGRFLNWNGSTGDPEFGGLIAQGQAFWVKAYSPVITPSLSVMETSKVNGQAAMFRTQTNEVSALTISLNQNGLTDRTFLLFNNQSTLRFDSQRDGLKQPNGYYNLATLTSDSVLVAIKNMPDTCSVMMALAIQNTKAGWYEMAFSGSALDTNNDRTFYLKDNYLDSVATVRADREYRFQVTAQPTTFGKKRFQLIAEITLPQPVISVAAGVLQSNAASGNQWLLNGVEIAGATQPTYTPVVSGSYQVRVIKAGCSKISAPFTHVITGTEPPPAVQLFPNPVQQVLYITGILNPTPYKLINQWGQVIQAGLLTPGTTEIELNSISGLYIFALEAEAGIQRHKLIIKK